MTGVQTCALPIFPWGTYSTLCPALAQGPQTLPLSHSNHRPQIPETWEAWSQGLGSTTEERGLPPTAGFPSTGRGSGAQPSQWTRTARTPNKKPERPMPGSKRSSERDAPPPNCRGRTSSLLRPPSYGRGASVRQGAGSNRAAPRPLGPLKSLSLPGKGRNLSDPVDETSGRHSHRPATLVAKRHVSLN